jgi:hypothetical protein
MPTIDITRPVAAPLERCFDLTRYVRRLRVTRAEIVAAAAEGDRWRAYLAPAERTG